MPLQKLLNKMIVQNTSKLRLHRRQFVIGRDVFRKDDNWCCYQLNNSLWLSYCPELSVDWTNDVDGVCWILLGRAVESLEEKPDPLVQIAQSQSADIPELYSSWAGRWALIGRSQLHMDASGLLGCFYGVACDRQTWVSSSPALLASILAPNTLLAEDSRKLRYEVGISWFTPPRSRFDGMYRLLPSQLLELESGKILPRPLMPPIDLDCDYDKTLELVQRSLVTTMQRLPKKLGKPWLGLTAGYDSRLMLAIAYYANIEVMPFTRISTRMALGDRLLPPKLSRECGYEHIFLRKNKGNPERQELVFGHTVGHVSDGDAQPFVQGVRDDLQGISFGGHGFAIASGFSKLRLLPNTFDKPERVAQQIAQLFGEPIDSTATAGLREWLEWTLENPQENLDWRDRFFIEQRQAGWLSSKEQLYDLVNLERFPILNAARNYSLLLGLEEKQRLDSLAQEELVRRLAPNLLKYPFNPDKQYFGVFRQTLIRTWDDPSYVYDKVASKLGQLVSKG